MKDPTNPHHTGRFLSEPNLIHASFAPQPPKQMQGVNQTMVEKSSQTPPPPAKAICDSLSWTNVIIDWLAGDGSDRCYYRLTNPQTLQTHVLMQLSGDDAKHLKDDDYEWIKIGHLLQSKGIHCPQTVASLPEFAALIIEDYGDTMMETAILEDLNSKGLNVACDYYRKSFQVLARLLQIKDTGRSNWKQRAFDAGRLDWELHFFREQFLEGILDWKFTPSEAKAFGADATNLAKNLAAASHYFVHRDFHSRNIMIKNGNLAIIDFQDARLGPATYDLVSLCFDSYIPLDFKTRNLLLEEGIEILSQSNENIKRESLSTEWPGMLLQRQLKAIGSFGYLTRKKNRGNYLRYVIPALATLPNMSVFDERWPFISGDLLTRMNNLWLLKESTT